MFVYGNAKNMRCNGEAITWLLTQCDLTASCLRINHSANVLWLWNVVGAKELSYKKLNRVEKTGNALAARK
jgi:hypothetical protein